MPVSFNYEIFEKLSHVDAFMYCLGDDNNVLLNNDFVLYFSENHHRLDDDHLVIGLAVLGKLVQSKIYLSTTLFYSLAKYIDHPNLDVRFAAIKGLTNFEKYDEINIIVLTDKYIRERVMETIEKHSDLFATKELKVLLDKFK